MQRVSTVRGLMAAAAVLLSLIYLPGCGGGGKANTTVTEVDISLITLSLNEGAVGTLSAIARNSDGAIIAADITFSSSNPAIATVSSGGLVCAGVWDANIINCTPTLGPGGVGQVTITATATVSGVASTATVYVHEQVDQVQAVLANSCTSMGQAVNISGVALSYTAPGCSPQSPCDITSTVGPFTFGSNDVTVAASSAGIDPTYSSTTNTPTYTSGGTITGSKGQTCNLSDFVGVIDATATVALTGTNTIASGTQLNITSTGYGAVIPPTTATLSNGTATCSGTAIVVTAITQGVLTAETPGATTVFASVSGVNGVGTPYLTCPVASIMVHDSGSSNTTFTLNPQGTQGLVADVADTMGQAIKPTLTWGSSSNATASVPASGISNANTVTAVTGGTAYITASCSYPDCNRSVPAQYSQNVATFNVTQPSATTVYAASSNSKSLVPINTGTNMTGTVITLPNYPNSIVPDPRGTGVYLGSDAGVMAFTTSTGTVTTYSATGTVLAVSPDGMYLLVSNTPAGVIGYVNTATGTLTTTPATATSSAYAPDSKFNEWVNADSLGFGLQTGFLGTVDSGTLGYAPSAVDISAQGGLTYIASAMGHNLDVRLTCDRSEDQALTAGSPTLVKALPNGSGAVAADSPNIDVVTNPTTLGAGCAVITPVPTIATYDLGAGPFNAQQVLVTSDSRRAWIVSDLPQLLSFDLVGLTPTSVPLAGGATAFNGGITPDGSAVYVGASDGTVHGIATASMTDVAQIAVNLTDANGNPTPPNLVTVVP